MAEREPSDAKNLDQSGLEIIPWSRALDAVSHPVGNHIFLGTVDPDGRPHSTGIGALWVDGAYYVVSGPGTRKSRDLAANPACTISASLQGIDLVFEGEATRVTDQATLQLVAERYRTSGWPAEVAGDGFTAPYNAPTAGPPPWYLYRINAPTVYGIATAEPYGATRWQFDQ